MALNDKLDELRSTEVKALVAQQQEQIAMLTDMRTRFWSLVVGAPISHRE